MLCHYDECCVLIIMVSVVADIYTSDFRGQFRFKSAHSKEKDF